METAHNIFMIYIGSLLAGFINGLFASGAGQLTVFLLIFLLKIETHKARATSVFLMGIVTVVTLVRYLSFVRLELKDVFLVAIVGGIFGALGAKIMKKISSNYLNLISGILITGLAIYSIFRG